MATVQNLGKYRILSVLGEGAMGRVYLAEDPDIGRKVAIKVMLAAADDESKQRFRNEARTAGNLAHPGIVTLLELGFDGDQPFLVMEYLEGESLEARLSRNPPLIDRLGWLVDLARAVDHAHRHGILHRDLKPSNVQILPDGRAKLLDFGIARGQSVRLTATGIVMGTPAFLAPEILRDGEYSRRSDIYAMSLLAFEALTGENPFQARTLEACLHRVLSHDPPAPSSLCPEIPPRLDAAILAGMAKDPEERPSDLVELIEALDAARTPELISETAETRRLSTSSIEPRATSIRTATLSQPRSQPTSQQIKAQPRVRRRRNTGILVAALVALLVAISIPWLLGKSTRQVSLPKQSTDAAGTFSEPLTARPPGDTPGDPPGDPATELSSALPIESSAETVAKKAEVSGSPAVSADRSAAADTSDTPAGPQPQPPPKQATQKAQTSPATRPSPTTRAVPPPAPDSQDASSQDGSTQRPSESTSANPVFEKPSTEATKIPQAAESVQPPPTSRASTTSTTSTTVHPPDSASESASETASEPVSEPGIRLDRIVPATLRLGSTATLEVQGTGLTSATKVLFLRSGRPARGLRIMSFTPRGGGLHVTVGVGRDAMLGSYQLLVVDDRAQQSNTLAIEVIL